MKPTFASAEVSPELVLELRRFVADAHHACRNTRLADLERWLGRLVIAARRDALVREVIARTDRAVRRHPYRAVATLFALGIWLGAGERRRPKAVGGIAGTGRGDPRDPSA